jgi:predicted CoA-substrate-specific enzyme activase
MTEKQHTMFMGPVNHDKEVAGLGTEVGNHSHNIKSLGICIGASTLSMVTVNRDDRGTITVEDVFLNVHHGNPQQLFESTFATLPLEKYDKVAVTGRKFRHLVNLTSIPEPEAVEKAFLHTNGHNPQVQAIVSAGSETFMLYHLGKDGRISSVHAGNKCASGTGEFFLQQIKRIGIGLEDAVRLARSEEPYKVSGRCSVFCKSDCTHATNKGVPKERVTAGLCLMMAGKIIELVKKASSDRVMVIGGCALNTVMIDHLRQEVPQTTVPDEAPYFEALGCALWALNNDTVPVPDIRLLFKSDRDTFFHLPPLRDAEALVDFKTTPRGKAQEGDSCILGLDVGSTTTKAVLVRVGDDRILASDYLRTNGDPVGASRSCYRSLLTQLGDLADRISIVGLGVTGSGRQIAGFHAMTDGIINEIIAHATGAAYFDRDVDTIFEIGGQDAKYTHMTNGVPSDYAMNEACSAGTGSFLEEAAKETLNIAMEEIAPIALKGNNPPNFNDQCAAFISSDIKNAFHEGISMEDIVAGLVYSICMNYSNRVKGSRRVGQKVFMQGGVCYNRAVPLAMATLTGKHIIVPPDPGLIGAFGVALEVKNRQSLGLLKQGLFSLQDMMERDIEYGAPFICDGGKEKCDRRCEIARLRISGKTYPFGGACNRWYNLRAQIKIDAEALNHVAHYERMIFPPPILPAPSRTVAGAKIGINKSFFTNSYFPLYRTFFERLGFQIALPEIPEREGIDLKSAEFCYPAELAHGYLFNLLKHNPDFLFLPQIKGDYMEHGGDVGVTCPLSQGEPYYLMSANKTGDQFKRLKAEGRILNPVIDFSGGYKAAEPGFTGMATRLGIKKTDAVAAYQAAVEAQERTFRELADVGRQALKEVENDPEAFAVVILGRSYNALVSEAHKGIPNKLASRGIRVIPLNALPPMKNIVKDNMYWSAGQRILSAAQQIKNHPQLFGCYVTNFSCGPDSFLIGYFREMMGKKPSLTLELDNHVADAGLETRIEAFIDIIKRYRELEKEQKIDHSPKAFTPARIRVTKNQSVYVDSSGRDLPLSDPRIHIIVPSMGRFLSEATAACFRSLGIRTSALPPADDGVLKLGRGHTSCKECLPLIITTGSFLKYVQQRRERDEKLVYFMPTASGPCRFGQYSIFLADLINRLQIPDAALLSPTAENSYSGVGGQRLALALWNGAVVASLFEEIHATLLTNAVSPVEAMTVFEKEWEAALKVLETTFKLKDMAMALEQIANRLSAIDVKRDLADTPVVLLAGEIFVRHDGISRQYLVEELARRGFASKVSTVLEWLYYTDWCVKEGVAKGHVTVLERLSLFLRNRFMKRREKLFREMMSKSTFCGSKVEDIDLIMTHASHLINPALAGEAILTVGSVLHEIVDHCCGAIAIGPFGCMPNRLAESILAREMNVDGKIKAGKKTRKLIKLSEKIHDLPFLAIESDGNRFPQIITAKLEAFLLQAGRLHAELQDREKH